MSERATHPIRTEPVIDRGAPVTGAGRLIILACSLVGVSIGFAIISPERSQPFILGLLAILAIIGVVTLFASAAGLIRIGNRPNDESFGKAAADSMEEGVLIADGKGRIVYANRAYGELTGAKSSRDIPSVERAFSGTADATEAIY